MKQKKRVSKSKKSSRRRPLSLQASVELPKGRKRGEDFLELYKPRKRRVTLRLDADVLEWFREPGRGYQTRINRALRGVMREEKG